MLTETLDTTTDLAVALLDKYSFDLTGYSARELMFLWETKYPVNWVHLAVIEALYQGRYKAVSVEQILAFWQRRGEVIYHFNSEFERLICRKFILSSEPDITAVLEDDNYADADLLADDLVVDELNHHTDVQSQTGEQNPDHGVNAFLPGTRVPVSQLSKFLEQQGSEVHSVHQVDHDALATTHSFSPIARFTPKSSGSEVFTSKLKGFVAQQEG